ncbi:hypothetical protein [Tepidimonas charontis]|uniref:Uncharacterized protein n=1 Tax=Tepidimonas charontis TaxID=2267262 RepID=A0A554XG69_9BURK|nr:hypothetical protein [Tepidimonas charontis]TSE34821.1 hypothetical protein Tchar_01175 [Tepidimonas charontis]
MHAIDLLLPAWGLAVLLAPWAAGRRRAAPWGAQAAAWGRVVLVLGALGSAVLLAGLWWSGRDGRMATYAALVTVVGTVAGLWRARRR